MKKLERRINTATKVRLEKRADGKPDVIAGIAAVTYDGTSETEYELWDFDSERATERILPGAFAKALSRPDDCRGLFNHDPNQVLGRTASGTMSLEVNGKGLLYSISPGNTSVAKDVSEHLDRKDVTGSSISFVVDEERWTETKDATGKWNILREILSVTLFDCGPVTFPAYESTTAGIRADGDVDEAKRALDDHRKAEESRQKQGKIAVELKTRLAGYAARARAIEVGGGERRDDMHPATKQALIKAISAVTDACSAAASKLIGLTEVDEDVTSALEAACTACEQMDGICDALLGEDDSAIAA